MAYPYQSLQQPQPAQVTQAQYPQPVQPQQAQYPQPTQPQQVQYPLPTQPYFQTQPQPQQLQNGGLIIGLGDEEIMNYPVAPGYFMSFVDLDRTKYTMKTMGVSPFDKPVIERYALARIDEPGGEIPAIATTESTTQEVDLSQFALKSDIEKLKSDIKKLKEKGGKG